MNFTQEQREVIKSAISEFLNRINNSLNNNKLREGLKQVDLQDEISNCLNKEYCVKVHFGTGKLLANKPSIAFFRKDILRDDLINGKKVTQKKGIYVYLEYLIKNKKFFTMIGGGINADIECRACELLTKQDENWYSKTFNSNELDDIVAELEKLISIFNKFSVDDFKPLQNDNKNSQITDNSKSNGDEMKQEKYPLNQILYGPPGTGKTYNTIVKAMEIIDDKNEEKEYEALKKRFDDLKQNGQIEFITFHQSYGYEEFVEGIKPVFDDENSQTNELKYEIKNGIFKEICEKALKNLENSQKSIEQLKIEYSLENLWNNFIANLNNELIEKSEIKFYKTMKIKRIGDNSVFISASSSEQSLSKDIFLRDYKEFKEDKIKNYKDIKPAGQSKAISHGNATYYFELFKQISEFEKNLKIENKDIEKEQEKPYILIIDEINRGNISKIFGELITLIEESKRIGNSEELRVALPYSGKKFDNGKGFGVPKNLYIIGTMNTADRSIALIDTALRRRFEFIEMMPKAKILGEIDGINLQKLLTEMNERIEFLLDREHTIGHAYFMEIKNLGDLKQVFKNKIIPLLQEYFYDDYEKIRAVLNDNGMITDKPKPKFNGEFSFIDDGKMVYQICKFNELTEKNFIKIYDNSVNLKEQNEQNEPKE